VKRLGKSTGRKYTTSKKLGYGEKTDIAIKIEDKVLKM